eukprot:364541-Chlamydomonas_euryale.AAC.9
MQHPNRRRQTTRGCGTKLRPSTAADVAALSGMGLWGCLACCRRGITWHGMAWLQRSPRLPMHASLNTSSLACV